MSIVATIIQARMGSTRLPGKVLKPIAGRPMLSYQLERLRRCERVDSIVVATTVMPADDPIVAFCLAEGVLCTRGSEHDVLSRYIDAARQVGATSIVRVTSDCPLLEPELVDQAIDALGGNVDYVSNMMQPTWPYGMAVEAMPRRVLEEAAAQASDPAEREHVTPFIYWRPERYRLKSLAMQPDLSEKRWTVDTPEDFDLVSRILSTLYPRKPDFGISDVLELLEQNPSWENINRHVMQRTVTSTHKEK
jgi:spore coat polysaccharide biosynthesis protein SpsF